MIAKDLLGEGVDSLLSVVFRDVLRFAVELVHVIRGDFADVSHIQ
jgi:hypothetical protein